MKASEGKSSHIKPVLTLFICLQALLFAPRLNSDGAYYYEYLRSWVLQGDLNFHDEREFYTWEWVPVLKDFLPGGWKETGYPPNIFSFGPALLWMPFFLIGHLLAQVLNLFGADISVTGYGFFHRFFPMTASMLAGLFTLYILDRTGAEAGFEPSDRSGALLVFLGASHYPAFLFVTPAFSHSFSVLFMTLFVWMWYRAGSGKINHRQSALFGVVAGMAAAVRWQNLFALVLPAVDALRNLPDALRERKRFLEWTKQWLSFSLGLMIAIFPQLLVTRTLYGKWVTDPQGEGGMHWFSPGFRMILFDGIKGLFNVNPVLLPAAIALPFLWRRNRRLTWGLILLSISQTYINAVRRDWAGVGFGMRRFLNMTPAFVLGLMVLFALVSNRRYPRVRKLIFALGGLLTLWNLLLMAQYYLSELGAPWVVMSFKEMVLRQFSTSPRLLRELVGSGMIGGGFKGDYAQLILGLAAIGMTTGLWTVLSKNEYRLENMWKLKAGKWLTGFLCVWTLLTGWLIKTVTSAETVHLVDLSGQGSDSVVKMQKVNPSGGFLGFRDGIRMGPGKQWTYIHYEPEYERNRFLAPGRLTLVPGLVHSEGCMTWSFQNPVEAQEIVLIFDMEFTREIISDFLIGEIALTDGHGARTVLPVRYGMHGGRAEDNPAWRAGSIERNWPALAPVESGVRNTRLRYDLGGSRSIRSVSICCADLPAEWTIHGLVLQSSSREANSAHQEVYR